jgi:hypothetical protein
MSRLIIKLIYIIIQSLPASGFLRIQPAHKWVRGFADIVDSPIVDSYVVANHPAKLGIGIKTELNERGGENDANLVLKTKSLYYINQPLASHVSGVMTMGMIKGKEEALQRPEIGVIQRQVDVLNTE